ncbi:bifunctional 3,4-dihydroxy-2-butanone-4-phosphate synthase/GTP cyclohydrolase II [Candidatus Peregrinibacteria bacterium CG10_big_fil_rev_8_21_14_0_10_55_24]|nr:MAG: bifunctional 3,4-dihydroxy-2-butanone-4-phosphate synthase/GTP cyclohydrolase II [Candidatus Peregrinibacteria bacterium CG10_big_fil_rev_8_21_14_0_10_55_24]
MSQEATIQPALDALRAGKMVIVVDDEDRENEGDLMMAAQDVDEESMAFFIRHTGGVVCMPLANSIADHLQLPPMVQENTSRLKTPFTVSIEAARGVTTGISARDRAVTIQTAISPTSIPADLRRPGHVFPLRADDGGVLIRAGHTEAAVDLCRFAGKRPGAVISELMHDDGTMMRRASIEKFSASHRIPVITIADIIAHRSRTEILVRREAETELETVTGMWKMVVFRDLTKNGEHVALVKGTINPQEPVLVRVHSECLTGDVLGSLHCDCGGQLHLAMQRIAQEGSGILLYLRQEGRGIGLANKVRAYALQHAGLDTVEANIKLGFPPDKREYGIGAQMLRDLGATQLRLLSNNPKKFVGLQGHGLHITEQIPLEIMNPSTHQKKYLLTKKKKLGHTLHNV